MSWCAAGGIVGSPLTPTERPATIHMNPPPLEWCERYTLGIHEIDAHHKHLLKVVNRLAAAIGTPEEFDQARKTVAELYRYIRKHFACDESVLHKSNSTRLNGLKKLHAEFTLRVAWFQIRLARRDEDLSQDIVSSLTDLFMTHLLGANPPGVESAEQ